MVLDRIEEAIMALIAIAMLTYLLPFSLARNIAVTVLIAFCLIVLLLLRSVSWHLQHITPFDGVLIFGILLSILYLVSFLAFKQTVLGVLLVLLFAFYYALMAFLLARHRGWLFGAQTDTDEHRLVIHPPLPSRTAGGHPRIQESRATTHTVRPAKRPLRFFHVDTHFTPASELAHDPKFRRGINPLSEVQGPVLGKVHGERFKRGMEPIPEVTAEHLHNLGVYDMEPKSKASKKKH